MAPGWRNALSGSTEAPMDQGLPPRSLHHRARPGTERFATGQLTLAAWDRMVRQPARRR